MTGSYETVQQVRELPAVRAVYDAFERGPGAGKMTRTAIRFSRTRARRPVSRPAPMTIASWCGSAAGVARQMGPETCAVVAGLVTRAHEAGVAERSRTEAGGR
jgi:hypothetical protein